MYNCYVNCTYYQYYKYSAEPHKRFLPPSKAWLSLRKSFHFYAFILKIFIRNRNAVGCVFLLYNYFLQFAFLSVGNRALCGFNYCSFAHNGRSSCFRQNWCVGIVVSNFDSYVFLPLFGILSFPKFKTFSVFLRYLFTNTQTVGGCQINRFCDGATACCCSFRCATRAEQDS